MSWFAEIAGKAENFLNKMDQTAAAALSVSAHEASQSQESLTSGSTVIPHLVTHQPRYTPTPVSTTVPAHSRNSSLGSSFSTLSSRDVTSNSGPSFSTPKHQKPACDDDKLLEFLNSKSTDISTHKGKFLREKSDEENGSNASIEVVSISSEEGKLESSGKASPTETCDEVRIPNEQEEDPIRESITNDSVTDSTISADSNRFQDTVSSLEKQISILTKRNVEAETEIKRLKKRLENWQSQLSSSDSLLREFKSREMDLKSTIEARDTSISVLKVRLQDADAELASKNETVESLQTQNEILLKEKESCDTLFGQDAEALRERIQQLENEIIHEKEQFQIIQGDSMKQIGSLEENNRVLVDEMSALQKDLRTERNTKREVDKQMKQLKSSYDALLAEFEEYKSKALQTLQSKDDVIRGLQRRSNEGDEGIADTNDFQVDYEESSKQIILLQAQCDSLVGEVQDLRTKNESLRQEISKLRNEEMEELNTKISVLEDELEDNKRLRNDLEQDLQQTQEELNCCREDFERVKCSLQDRIEDRNKEVDKLRRQLVAKRSSPADSSVHELESRVKNLTQSLIQKQTAIEQLSSERQSLALQLERSENRLKAAFEEATRATSPPGSHAVSIGMVHSASASNLVNRSGYKLLTEDNPNDGHVTRRVKKVYNQFDSFSIRLGQFLRVYPSARIMLLVYIFVLHVWVFFVLLYYRPEIHEKEP